ncbi:MAG: hypothetical protein SPI30_08920 [Prevotella sp.]|nr:hypothetical protein [Prevotella sp.]
MVFFSYIHKGFARLATIIHHIETFESVAEYVKEKRRRRCRQADKISRKSTPLAENVVLAV